MPGGWVAAYRLLASGPEADRKTEILELRIFPHEDGHEPGEWSARVLGDRVQPPRASFSFAQVRKMIVERAFNEALAAHNEDLEQKGANDVFDNPSAYRTRTPDPDLESRWAPGKLTNRFLAEFAVRYNALEHVERHHKRTSVRSQLAREHGKSLRTVAGWIAEAKKRGFLEPTRPGQRGARVTPRALKIVRSAH